MRWLLVPKLWMKSTWWPSTRGAREIIKSGRSLMLLVSSSEGDCTFGHQRYRLPLSKKGLPRGISWGQEKTYIWHIRRMYQQSTTIPQFFERVHCVHWKSLEAMTLHLQSKLICNSVKIGNLSWGKNCCSFGFCPNYPPHNRVAVNTLLIFKQIRSSNLLRKKDEHHVDMERSSIETIVKV